MRWKRSFLTLIKTITRIGRGCIKMKPQCPAGLDPASHPVDAVGTRRVALGYARMGLRVEARKDTRESTFNILRKYFHRLTKVYSVADESAFENPLPLPP